MSTKSGGWQGSYGQRNKGNRTPFPVPISALLLRQVGALRVALVVVTCALISVVPAAAQPELIRCRPKHR
jgi:hypothetical protein